VIDWYRSGTVTARQRSILTHARLVSDADDEKTSIEIRMLLVNCFWCSLIETFVAAKLIHIARESKRKISATLNWNMK
jgi:uncharacterized integral membrane protein